MNSLQQMPPHGTPNQWGPRGPGPQGPPPGSMMVPQPNSNMSDPMQSQQVRHGDILTLIYIVFNVNIIKNSISEQKYLNSNI